MARTTGNGNGNGNNNQTTAKAYDDDRGIPMWASTLTSCPIKSLLEFVQGVVKSAMWVKFDLVIERHYLSLETRR